MKNKKRSMSIEDVELVYTEEIKKWKTVCKKNKYNVTSSKLLLSYLKEYTTLLLKKEALSQNIAPSDLDFKNTNIKINII